MERISDPETQAARLQKILDASQDKRIMVVGTTCTGKSTLLRHINEGHDMDELVFPTMTKEKKEYVNSTPWTPKIGNYMIQLVRERVEVKPGEPVFGTVVLPSDLIVCLKISDDLLKERVEKRGDSFEDAKNMQNQIEEEIEKSETPLIEFPVG